MLRLRRGRRNASSRVSSVRTASAPGLGFETFDPPGAAWLNTSMRKLLSSVVATAVVVVLAASGVEAKKKPVYRTDVNPIIFVHGVVTTSTIFPVYLNAYSPAYRGIAVDLRGYGESQKPDTGFTIPQFSKDLIALADALHIEQAVWVGVSMGGMILQRLALDYPDRVRALVLGSTPDGHHRRKLSTRYSNVALSAAAGPNSYLEWDRLAGSVDQHVTGECPWPIAQNYGSHAHCGRRQG